MNSYTVSPFINRRIAGIFLLILMSSIVYFNSFKGAFQFDDRNLLSKEWITDIESFNKNVELQAFQNRPILLWTFSINNQLNSKSTFGFHLANITLHVLVTVLIFLSIIRIQYFSFYNNKYLDPPPKNLVDIKYSETLFFPFSVALIFAIHPISTDSVTYISSRSSLLATFFILLTVYFFTRLLANKHNIMQFLFLSLITIIGIYLAVASKLIAVALPIIMVFWFLIFFSPLYYPGLSDRIFSFKMNIFYSFAIISFIAISHFFNVMYLPKDQGLELFGRIPYLLIQAKIVIFYYIKLFFLPFNLNVDSGFPFSLFNKDWMILFSIACIIGIIFIVYKWGNIWIKSGVAWFILTLTPTSTLVPLSDLAVEHRMYLPMSLGLCLVVGWFLSNIKKINQLRSLVFILIIFGSLTINRNEVWLSEITLWSDSALKNPNSPRVNNNLGKAYFELGDLEKARFYLEKSVINIPKYIEAQYNIKNDKKFSGKASFAEPHYNLASTYLDLGLLDKAEGEYEKALKLKGDYYAAQFGLGSVKNLKGQYDSAISHFMNSIALMRKATGQSDYALARLNIGEVYGKTKRFDQAIIQLKLAIQQDPSLVVAHYNLGTAYMNIGADDNAEFSFKTSLELNKNYKPALFNLAKIYQNKNQFKKSTDTFKKFLVVNGPNISAYLAMASNSLMVGKNQKAKILYEKVLEFEPNNEIALTNLGKIYFSLDNKEISRSYIERALKHNLPKKQANELTKLLKRL